LNTDDAIANAAKGLARRVNERFALRYSLREGMDVNIAGRIAWLAVEWREAEIHRQIRQREKRQAFLVAFRLGAAILDDGSGEWEIPTPEAQAALELAFAAKARYLKAAGSAGSLHAHLNRRLREFVREPVPNAEVVAAYDALCARESAAAALLEGDSL
jgi:hypothetical protein